MHFVAAVIATLLLGSSDGTGSTPGPSPWPGGRWTPDKPQYGMIVAKKVPIEMNDGATLYADIGYPADLKTGKRAKGTFPVLLSQNQYFVPTSNMPFVGPYKLFVTRGYIYVVAQVRGTGITTGPGGKQVPNDMFSERQAEDGAELVDWAARKLDRSNGVVGLDGLSFLGISQIFTAAKLGPNSPVKAICPASTGHSYTLYFPGGIMSELENLEQIQPANLILGVKNYAANVNHQKWLFNQYYEGKEQAYNGDYWQGRTTSNMAGKIVENGIPALLWTGWNAAELADAIELYTAFQNAAAGLPPLGPMSVNQPVTGRYQIIIGDWAHGFGIDQTLELEWFDHWLKGKDTGIDRTSTPMHLYEQHGNRWVNTSRVPFTDTYTTYYSGHRGGLTRHPPAKGHDTILWAKPDQPGSRRLYTSPPLERTMTIAGTVTATIWASSSNTNMELIAVLYDVSPDGHVKEISHGTLLGSLRAVNTQESWYDVSGTLIQARHPFLYDDYLTPGATDRFDINLYPTLWKVGAGHALRLEIHTQAASSHCTMLGALGLAWPCALTRPQKETLPGGKYTLFHGGTTATCVNIPLIDPSSLPTARGCATPTSFGFIEPMDWGTER
jgi:predicted acyl esterase